MAVSATPAVTVATMQDLTRRARKFRRGDIIMSEFTRIISDPAVMGGKPCNRGMRVTVGRIVAQIGSGWTIDELLAGYPYLERDDILEALRYAAEP
jgi:uncharacterized protein (DUF433 family)